MGHYVGRQQLTLLSGLLNSVQISLGEAGNKSVSVLRSLTAAVTDGESDNSSDSGFSDSNDDSINDVLEDLKVDTTCLLDLEPLLSSPILRTDAEPTAVIDTTRITWTPHQPYSDKVSVRFPMAADDLVNRLGRANYERYLRCQEQKATNELGDIPLDQGASGALDSAISKFHDSGIGSSLPTAASSYAETAMSYGMGEGRRVRVPPLPVQAKEGLPFACVACGRWVKIVTNSAWKKHVYGDLEPWICLEAQCVSGIDSFPTRDDWISHLSLHHRMEPEWRMVECPLCRVEIGPGKVLITKHMGDHLEEISLAALPPDCEFDDETDEVSIDDPMDDLTPTHEGAESPTSIEVEPDEEPYVPDIPECPTCQWRPDRTVLRSIKKEKLAVERHIKRNHKAQNYSCPICPQTFRNRPDNVKPHVARKHPESYHSLYPKKAAHDDQHEQLKTPPKTTVTSKAKLKSSEES